MSYYVPGPAMHAYLEGFLQGYVGWAISFLFLFVIISVLGFESWHIVIGALIACVYSHWSATRRETYETLGVIGSRIRYHIAPSKTDMPRWSPRQDIVREARWESLESLIAINAAGAFSAVLVQACLPLLP